MAPSPKEQETCNGPGTIRIPNLWEQVQALEEERKQQGQHTNSLSRKYRLKKKIENMVRTCAPIPATPGASSNTGVPPSPAEQALALLKDLNQLTRQTIEARTHGQDKLVAHQGNLLSNHEQLMARQDSIDLQNRKDLHAAQEVAKDFVCQITHLQSPAATSNASSAAGSGTGTFLSTDSQKANARDLATKVGRLNLLKRLQDVAEEAENKEESDEEDTVFVKAQHRANGVAGLLAVEDCVVAVVDGKIQIFGLFCNGGLSSSAFFNSSTSNTIEVWFLEAQKAPLAPRRAVKSWWYGPIMEVS